jgi:DNA-binding response OmpR family regulator
MEILVIEDEESIADFLRKGLEGEGYAVGSAADGDEGERLALSGDFDLILLDLMLPDRSGLEVLASIRARLPAVPVIVLTARGAVDDRVRGLDAGANDYIAKPFSFDELAARVRAQLRLPESGRTTRLDVGELSIDLMKRTVERAGETVQLSATEFDLLTFFARHPGQVLTRESLLRGVWGYDFDPGTNTLGVYVSYLRKKLERSGLESPIETIRSVGYRLRPDG